MTRGDGAKLLYALRVLEIIHVCGFGLAVEGASRNLFKNRDRRGKRVLSYTGGGGGACFVLVYGTARMCDCSYGGGEMGKCGVRVLEKKCKTYEM